MSESPITFDVYAKTSDASSTVLKQHIQRFRPDLSRKEVLLLANEAYVSHDFFLLYEAIGWETAKETHALQLEGIDEMRICQSGHRPSKQLHFLSYPSIILCRDIRLSCLHRFF